MTKKDIERWRHETQSVPLRVPPLVRTTLLTHPSYKHRDTVELAHEASKYVKGRLTINSREMAIAVLLSRDQYEVKHEQSETRYRSACAGV